MATKKHTPSASEQDTLASLEIERLQGKVAEREGRLAFVRQCVGGSNGIGTGASRLRVTDRAALRAVNAASRKVTEAKVRHGIIEPGRNRTLEMAATNRVNRDVLTLEVRSRWAMFGQEWLDTLTADELHFARLVIARDQWVAMDDEARERLAYTLEQGDLDEETELMWRSALGKVLTPQQERDRKARKEREAADLEAFQADAQRKREPANKLSAECKEHRAKLVTLLTGRGWSKTNAEKEARRTYPA